MDGDWDLETRDGSVTVSLPESFNAEIDAETRDLLVHRFALGRTLSQIGGLFGLAPGAVDGRITRALRTLRRRADTHQ